jgi:hypothetical protein
MNEMTHDCVQWQDSVELLSFTATHIHDYNYGNGKKV